jgi:DNA-binding NarL/FixJ family response regulator
MPRLTVEEYPTMTSYRIVLADNHPLLRQGLKRILAEKSDIEVIGEAGDGLELINLLSFSNLAPHMVILDPSMPNLRGTEVIHKVKTLYPDVKVLILSLHKDKEYLSQAISHGAEGYLPKEDMDKELLPAIEMIRQGGVYVPPFP